MYGCEDHALALRFGVNEEDLDVWVLTKTQSMKSQSELLDTLKDALRDGYTNELEYVFEFFFMYPTQSIDIISSKTGRYVVIENFDKNDLEELEKQGIIVKISAVKYGVGGNVLDNSAGEHEIVEKRIKYRMVDFERGK